MKHLITYPNLPQRLLKARDNLMSHFRPILNHFGVTEQQWRILRVLDERGHLEPHELCALCQISSSSMAGVLARMVDMGLLARNRIAADQRRVLVYLADEGQRLLGEMGPLIDLQYVHIEQAYGEEVFRELFDALEKFNGLDTIAVPPVKLPQK